MFTRSRAARRVLHYAFAGLVFTTTLVFATINPYTVQHAQAFDAGGRTKVDIGTRLRTLPGDKVAKAAKVGLRMNPYVRTGTLILTGMQLADSYFMMNDAAGEGQMDKDPVESPCRNWAPGEKVAVTITSYVGRVVNYTTKANNCGFSSGFVDGQIHCRVGTGPTTTHNVEFGRSDRNGTYHNSVACPTGTGNATGVGVKYPTNPGDTTRHGPTAAQDHSSTTTVRCRRVDGSFFTITDTVKGAPGVVVVPSCSDREADSIPWEIGRESGPDGTPPRKDFEVLVDDTILTDYPDCFANGALECVVTVWVDGQPCTADRAVCHDWNGMSKDDPRNVRCMFGPYRLSLQECALLKDSFKTRTRTKTKDKTDPDGQLVPEPSAPPGTGTGTIPDSGVNPSTPTPQPDTSTDPDTQNCFGGMWSWNPVDWVYVPVKCAFLWAFKPKVNLGTMIATWKDTATGAYPFNIIPPALPSAVGGGCPNWVVKVGETAKNVVCQSSYIDALRGSRGWIAGGMLMLAFWPLIRGLLFASIPILKPTPSGKD